jgi:hypothetical protein
MDAAKVMWLMYEVPDIKFEGLSMRSGFSYFLASIPCY